MPPRRLLRGRSRARQMRQTIGTFGRQGLSKAQLSQLSKLPGPARVGPWPTRGAKIKKYLRTPFTSVGKPTFRQAKRAARAVPFRRLGKLFRIRK